ncbi:MAG: bifunctional hydroxymethylpyrimidine kinase/phosphomethylpyrimidine kinase [Acidobacteria bacterium]|nr:MAG: bifunctional hydroxymethylpyrimidine kinase/phosphomethylpyrimidine kinase [Acidobacteriota bacterium]PYR49277.1 MAG: bifunctional hydroxymethylpyrimidine kinase/phosphomethylpyrimidine kinase [Acidobacteriota bacterium]
MRTALTIAGSDSSGGAGIQADLKTFAAFGLYGASAITAITVQSTKGVEAVAPLAADLVTAQIEAVAGDLALHATKIGMLATAAIVEAVAAAIEELELPLVVLDPVLVSTSGDRLLDPDGVQTLCMELMPLARVVTPNIPEAEALSGRTIGSAQQAREAARRIHDMGAASVIVTGGHAVWDGDTGPRAEGAGPQIIDLLFDGHVFHEFRTARIDTRPTHGTGCTFASAVAAGLALGRELPDAVARAQQYVAGAVAHALGIGHGCGPIDHFWEHRSG